MNAYLLVIGEEIFLKHGIVFFILYRKGISGIGADLVQHNNSKFVRVIEVSVNCNVSFGMQPFHDFKVSVYAAQNSHACRLPVQIINRKNGIVDVTEFRADLRRTVCAVTVFYGQPWMEADSTPHESILRGKTIS